ncbi:hypothetical protein N9852_04955 [Alphaproteobacteria bacterium]|nr:hypothetical protein [Alphaproteobacteria bacterium]
MKKLLILFLLVPSLSWGVHADWRLLKDKSVGQILKDKKNKIEFHKSITNGTLIGIRRIIKGDYSELIICIIKEDDSNIPLTSECYYENRNFIKHK